MMSKRLLPSLMLVVFVWMLVWPSVAAAFEPSGRSLLASITHADGSHCPDADDGGPCDGGCQCACCPGHAPMVPSPLIISLATYHLAETHRFGPPEVSHPTGIHLRVFRPPRV